MTADQILASKTDQQLIAGIDKGHKSLILIAELENEMPGWDGPFPPSKNFENWSAADFAERRRLLNIGIAECRKELLRRKR